MIYLDAICVTNINRHMHAMDGNIGQQKINNMEARIKAINPECSVINTQGFYSERALAKFS